jgi:hypothetical protein
MLTLSLLHKQLYITRPSCQVTRRNVIAPCTRDQTVHLLELVLCFFILISYQQIYMRIMHAWE